MFIDWNLLPTNSILGLRGSIQSDHETLTISTGISHDLAEFILWYRRFIPREYNLYLFGSSSFERIELTQETSAESILTFIEAHA